MEYTEITKMLTEESLNIIRSCKKLGEILDIESGNEVMYKCLEILDAVNSSTLEVVNEILKEK